MRREVKCNSTLCIGAFMVLLPLPSFCCSLMHLDLNCALVLIMWSLLMIQKKGGGIAQELWKCMYLAS